MEDDNFQVEMSESGLNPSQVAGERDDDGRPRRTGNVWTASAHIITTTIGSGVLSLAWGMAQLGWLGGGATLLLFSLFTMYTSNLLADCYRSPDPITGTRSYSYKDAVKANLGGRMYVACGAVQYAILSGMAVGYTITTSISMVAIQKSNCHHTSGHEAQCNFSYIPHMIGIGIFEVFLSQIPNFHKVAMISVVAAIMSFGYSSLGMGLSFAKLVSGGKSTSLTGIEVGMNLTASEKTWRMFRALGDIAFAFSYAQLLIEIQDTINSAQPENKVMKKANVIAVSTTTTFYMMCGFFGYAAFGNNTPGNLLTGFYEPFWLVDLANIFIVVHLLGAYQVYSQPVFGAFEFWARRRWSKSAFVEAEYPVGFGKFKFNVNFLKLTWRTAYVVLATLMSMALPFFNDILALLGAIAYWPLTVYFPVEMYIAKAKIRRWSRRWLGLQFMNLVCFLVAVAAACGSIQGLIKALGDYKPFQAKE